MEQKQQIEQVLEQMREDIQLRGFSEHTESQYLTQTRLFLEFVNCPIDELNEQHFRNYLKYLLYTKKLSPATINVYNSCIRFMFEVTLNKYLNFRQIPRLREATKLPEILTKEEISLLFSACTNIKHKSILMLAYGSGLRVSEIVHLTIPDIQSKTMRIFVRSGKGKKDRYTILSQSCLETLRTYYKAYRPKQWLFEGQSPENHLSSRTAQVVFDQTLTKAGIHKPVSIHSLRHAFATHLLEAGANLIEIKQLLGHTFIQSTSYYLHLTNIAQNIKSPLDVVMAYSSAGGKTND